jgi:hypothetical protein
MGSVPCLFCLHRCLHHTKSHGGKSRVVVSNRHEAKKCVFFGKTSDLSRYV